MLIYFYSSFCLIIIIYLTFYNYKIRHTKGRKGFKGYDGDQGDKGNQGLKGARGLMGIRGNKGLRGSNNGEHGMKGYRGYIGEKGAKGLKGYRGYKGEKGDPGERGGIGKQGQTGMAGFDGSIGSHGEYIYVKVDEDSCKFTQFGEDRQVKCPYGYVLRGVKNESNNYEGYCCKLKLIDNCRDLSLSRKLNDYKEKMVGTQYEQNYLTLSEQENKNLYSDLFGKKYLPINHIDNYKCYNLKRLLIQGKTKNLHINAHCTENDYLLEKCERGIKKESICPEPETPEADKIKAFVFQENKFVDIYDLFKDDFYKYFEVARLKVVNENPMTEDKIIVIDIRLDIIDNGNKIELTFNKLNLELELELVNIYTKELLTFKNDTVTDKIFINFDEIFNSPIPDTPLPAIDYEEEDVNEIKQTYNFLNNEYVSIHDLFEKEYSNLVVRAQLKILNITSEIALEVKINIPNNLFGGGKVIEIFFNRNNLDMELELILSFNPQNVNYKYEKPLKMDLLEKFTEFQLDRYTVDNIIPRVEGDVNNLRCCTIEHDNINNTIDFYNLINLDKRIITDNIYLEWEKIEDFMLKFPNVDKETYDILKIYIDGSFMPLKKVGADSILRIKNIHDFESGNEVAYIVSDINGDESDIKVYIINKYIKQDCDIENFEEVPVPFNTPVPYDESSLDLTEELIYRIKIELVDVNISKKVLDSLNYLRFY